MLNATYVRTRYCYAAFNVFNNYKILSCGVAGKLSTMAQPVSTRHHVNQLRELMVDLQVVPDKLGAYIIPSEDAHASEYLADCDKRREFITGFSGSAGTAIVTADQACLWTDGRYWTQAKQQMESCWTLQKEGLPNTPTQEVWLSKVLPPNSAIGVDPTLISHGRWSAFQDSLESDGHKLLAVERNLIDMIWQNKPAMPCNPVIPHPLQYSGIAAHFKLQCVREKMQEKNAAALILTELDEIAWLLNLRGSDIEFNPVFFAYVLITSSSLTVFVDEKKLQDPKLQSQIIAEFSLGDCRFEPYTHLKKSVESVVRRITKGKVWVGKNVNQFIVSLIPEKLLHFELSPIQLLKAIKNETELKGMRNAHIRDGVALCSYFQWLTENIEHETITEISGAKKLEQFRALQADFVGPSFDTISSVGANAAIIHYKPTKETDVRITSDQIYLCDSGGQYKDGTTDVTRTMHFSKPTDQERECFSLVLKGQIAMSTAKFPNKIKGNCLDSFARQYLWNVGLDYGHGTGHGIGSYLNVHEGPMEISWRVTKEDQGLEKGMCVSNEPGFYEEGKFGIRIEDIVEIVETTLPHNFNNRGYLTFNTLTLCPIQTKMIKVEMLTEKEINHVNDYHKKCRDILGPELNKQGLIKVKDWLWKETEPIGKNSP